MEKRFMGSMSHRYTRPRFGMLKYIDIWITCSMVSWKGLCVFFSMNNEEQYLKQLRKTLKSQFVCTLSWLVAICFAF